MRRLDDTQARSTTALRAERRYIAAPDLMLETHDKTHAVIVDTGSGARVKVSIAVYRLLARFDVPRTIDEVFGHGHDDRAVSRIDALLERGLLVDMDRPRSPGRSRRVPTPYRFCQAPPCSSVTGVTDIVVIGVPYDLGGPLNGRDGPVSIRRQSLDYTYLVDFETRRPRGWFDARRGERILEGITLSDADDVAVVYGQTQAALFDRLRETLDELLCVHGMPLVLAGDRSIAFAVAAYFAATQSLDVVQFAPGTTAAPRAGETITIHDVGRAMSALDGVVLVTTIGLRDGDAVPDDLPAGVTEVTREAWRTTARTDAGSARVGEHPLLLSIDLGVIDTSMPPSGEGFSLAEILDAIDAVGRCARIVGIVIAGLDPEGTAGHLRTLVACHVALHAMHVATCSRTSAS